MIITGKYTINAQAEKVWNTLKSFDNVENYIPIVKKTEVQGSGVGATRICTIAQQDGGTGKLTERLESLDESQKTISIALLEGPVPASNAIFTIKVNSVDANRTELEFISSAEPKGVNEDDLRNNFLPVYKMIADGLEKLHQN